MDSAGANSWPATFREDVAPTTAKVSGRILVIFKDRKEPYLTCLRQVPEGKGKVFWGPTMREVQDRK